MDEGTLAMALVLRPDATYRLCSASQRQTFLMILHSNAELIQEIIDYKKDRESYDSCAARKRHKFSSDMGHGIDDDSLYVLLDEILTGPRFCE